MSEADEPGQAEPKRRPGRRARRLARAAAAALALPVVFAIVAALALFGRDVSAPSWVVEEVEARAAALTGGELSVGHIAVTLGRDLHPRVRLSDAVLRDADGTEVARIPKVDALISPRGVLFRRTLLVQRIEVAGAVVDLSRDEDGRLAVAFGVPGAEAAPDLVGLLGALDRATARAELEALEDIRAEGLVVNYVDARAGRSWTVDGGNLAVSFGREELEIAADLSLMSGLAEPTVLSARYVSPRGRAAADLWLTADRAMAADLASQSAALSWLAVLDAPLTASLRATLDDAGALSDFDAALALGAGALRPSATARPVPFDAARTHLAYDPRAGVLRFDLIEIDGAAGSLQASGRAYLGDMEHGLPEEIVGQFEVVRASANPGALYRAPLEVTGASADIRLELQPFRLTVAGARALLAAPGEEASEVTPAAAPGVPEEVRAGTEILGGARVWTGPQGWHVAVDGTVDGIGLRQALDLWPEGWRPGVRSWLESNILSGEMRDATVALRAEPGAELLLATDFSLAGAEVRFLPRMPVLEGVDGFVEIVGRSFAVSLDKGRVVAPEGGELDLAGSTMVIPVMGLDGAPVEFGLEAAGPIPALLSVLDQPPLRLMERAGLESDISEGTATVSGRLFMPLVEDLTPEAVSYVMAAELAGVDAVGLIPDRRLTAARLDLAATPDGLEIAGRAEVDGVPVEGAYRKAFTRGAPGVVEAGIALSAATLDSFGIALPAGVVTGQAEGRLTLRMPDGQPPDFALISTLQGVRLSLPWIGWNKPAGDTGAFEIAGTLGRDPRIDRLSLSAGGLEARGRIDLGPGGTFQAARFDRLTVGNWLDAPVTLRSRGDGRPVAVDMPGGRLDMRRARFGTGEAETGEGGPLSIRLDRLQVTDTLVLTEFVGAFRSEGGLGGTFTALVNDGPEIQGNLVPWQGRTGVRLTSQDGGAVLRAAELLPNASGGGMELILQPTGGEGSFNGTLRMTDLRVRDAPAMAALLNAVSVVGLLQQLDGQGLAFSDVEAQFRMTPEAIVVTAASAVGPSLGVSLDGTYGMASQVMDFQGVVSPLYLLNGLGAVLTRPGEGLIGFSFRLGGTVGRPQVQVNPLSVLTPGMFREIFRRPPPQVGQ